MAGTETAPEPTRIETGVPGLSLVQMLTAEDDQAYYDLQNNNLDYWKEFGNTIDESVDAVRERRLQHGDGRFGIWLGGMLIGMVGYSTKHSKDEAEIGILLDKEAAGHGYAAAALKTLTDYAIPRFSLVYAEVAPNNKRSIRLLNRVGYQLSGKAVVRDWGEALVFEAPK